MNDATSAYRLRKPSNFSVRPMPQSAGTFSEIALPRTLETKAHTASANTAINSTV